jgi:hypothetical protein
VGAHELRKQCREGQGNEQRSIGRGCRKLTPCEKNGDKGRGDEQSRRDGKRGVGNSQSVEKMPMKDAAMSRAAENPREASETHTLWNECREGQGNEQSSRESKVSFRISRAVERIPTKDRIMS